MARTDVLSYCVMASASLGLGFGRETHAWADGAMDYLTADKWTRAKEPTASRWDRKLYNDTWVTDWITELDDSNPVLNPRNFKKNVQNRIDPVTMQPADGVIMFPRWIDDSNDFQSLKWTAKPQSGHWNYMNCASDKVMHLLSDIKHTLSGMFQLDHGGDVGLQPTLIHNYEWSKFGLRMLEENYYAKNYGWVRWAEFQWDSAKGQFVSTGRISVHNKLVARTIPPLNFPCKF